MKNVNILENGYSTDKSHIQNKNKVVLFDLDGTLIDSAQDITDAMNKMLSNRGFDKITIEEMRSFLGAHAKEIVRLSIKKEIPDSELDDCLIEYTNNYIGSGYPKTKPFDNIPEVLAVIKERGFRFGAVSNKPVEELVQLQSLFESLGIEEVLGLSGEIPPKPNPYGARLIMEKLGGTEDTTYFVGDGETDVMTAINANMNCVAVLWGNRNQEFLEKYGATVFAKKPTDLLDIIK